MRLLVDILERMQEHPSSIVRVVTPQKMAAYRDNGTSANYLGNSIVSPDGYSAEQVDYHIDLAIEYGLLNRYARESVADIGYRYSLTWDAHEFLDELHQDGVRDQIDGWFAASWSVLREMTTKIATSLAHKAIENVA